MGKIRQFILGRKYKFMYHRSTFETVTESEDYFIIEKKGRGLVRVTLFDKNELNRKTQMYLFTLSVQAKNGKQGIGTALMNEAEDFARKKGLISVKLQVRGDSWMRKWYEKLGYLVYNRCEDDPEYLWMIKIL